MRVTCSIMTCLLMLSKLGLADDDQGFKPLFDGKTLVGWTVVSEKPGPPDEWTWNDGVLAAKPASSWLKSNQTYRDFILELEFRVPVNGNSGVFLRVPDLKENEHPWTHGMEIQILDDAGPVYKGKLKDWQYTGSIYGVVPAKDSTFKGAGEWNTYKITCRGDKVEVVLNGKVVSQADMSAEESLKNRSRTGHIGLQNHGTGVEFRNVRIKTLE
jgi:hypothetical protein